MYSALTKNAAFYSKMGIETEVLSASPHKLITLLLNGAVDSISLARRHMLEKNYEMKSNAITKAMNILDEGLKGSLDLRKGGEIAIQLHSLYSYMSGRLFLANLKNQPEMLDEVTGLLGQISDAWIQIDPARAERKTHGSTNPISIAA